MLMLPCYALMLLLSLMPIRYCRQMPLKRRHAARYIIDDTLFTITTLLYE